MLLNVLICQYQIKPFTHNFIRKCQFIYLSISIYSFSLSLSLSFFISLSLSLSLTNLHSALLNEFCGFLSQRFKGKDEESLSHSLTLSLSLFLSLCLSLSLPMSPSHSLTQTLPDSNWIYDLRNASVFFYIHIMWTCI